MATSHQTTTNGTSKTVEILLLIQNSVLDRRLTSSARQVLIRLLTHYNHKTELCNPSEQVLAVALGMCERSVRTSIKQLKDTEWIFVKRNRRDDSNCYSFNWTRAVKIDLRTDRQESSDPSERQISSYPRGKSLPVREAISFQLDRQDSASKHIEENILNEPNEKNTQRGVCDDNKEKVNSKPTDDQFVAEITQLFAEGGRLYSPSHDKAKPTTAGDTVSSHVTVGGQPAVTMRQSHTKPHDVGASRPPSTTPPSSSVIAPAESRAQAKIHCFNRFLNYYSDCHHDLISQTAAQEVFDEFYDDTCEQVQAGDMTNEQANQILEALYDAAYEYARGHKEKEKIQHGRFITRPATWLDNWIKAYKKSWSKRMMRQAA
jgi:Helix-turn-helix domain